MKKTKVYLEHEIQEYVKQGENGFISSTLTI